MRILFLVLAAMVFAGWRPFPALAMEPGITSTKEGVYTDEQAKRGADVSTDECARCHSASLQGGENNSPALVGADFLARWNGKTLAELFEKISTTMPTDSPGRLSKSNYINVLAFILSKNGYPAGSAPLKPDAESLKFILVEP